MSERKRTLWNSPPPPLPPQQNDIRGTVPYMRVGPFWVPLDNRRSWDKDPQFLRASGRAGGRLRFRV